MTSLRVVHVVPHVRAEPRLPAGFCFVEFKNPRAAAEVMRSSKASVWPGLDGNARNITTSLCVRDGGEQANMKFVWGAVSGSVELRKGSTAALRWAALLRSMGCGGWRLWLDRCHGGCVLRECGWECRWECGWECRGPAGEWVLILI